MHHPLRVCIRERARHVAQNAHRLANRERPLLQPRAQREPIDVRHRVVRQPRRITGAQHGNDVRLLESRGELDFPREALGAHPLHEFGSDDLDHHFAPQRHLVGHEDARHPTATELALECVGGA